MEEIVFVAATALGAFKAAHQKHRYANGD